METESSGLSTTAGKDKVKEAELMRWVEKNPLTITFSPAGRKKERKERRKELDKSKHAIPDLTAEQVERLAREKVEGAGGTEVEENEYDEEGGGSEDKEMEGDDEGEEGEETRWNAIWDNRDMKAILVCIIKNGKVVDQIAGLQPKERSFKLARDAATARDLIRASGGTIEGGWWIGGNESGKGGWKSLSDGALMEGNLEFIRLVSEAERIWRSSIEIKRAGTAQQVAQAKRTLNAQKGKVEEEKWKMEEVKKVDRKRKEVDGRLKEEEKHKKEAEKLATQSRALKESQEWAKEACEASIRELVSQDKSRMNAHELIEVGQKLREAEEMKKKIEEELASPLEKTVGKTRQVVAGEVFKMVRIVMEHM
ncbi:hypothetical protein L211DRAFT_849114 [Terfezia boudieri ATCC MYA-4762]|uniref:Uncharacterized protein n=1 Tax=Terfezia boudieri ATCC MYA-4762 TaxID=1051890 RepID=A0A3N4LTI5_9PEZI|nr:hypothetical protein L211DRAFT_849114 [Terfezia boudieri ATCC MYA-4762]